jgi:phage anti-repressor protein
MDPKDYIKKFTSVPVDFIDEFFALYTTRDGVVLQTDFVIRLETVAKWLKAQKYILVKTLRKTYREGLDFIVSKPTDVIKKDPRNNNHKLYLLTPDCFKRLAMMSHSKNAELVRSYFIEVEGLFLRYKDEVLLGMQAQLESKKKMSRVEPKQGYVYIVRASEKHDGLYKIGRSQDLLQRIKNYNTGRVEDVEVLYVFKTEDTKGTEGCVKTFLKQFQLKKYKEVYQANLTMIKELMRECGKIGNKLQWTKRKSEMSGGYYVVVATNS